MIHTVKGFNVVCEADVYLELSCFLDDPADVGNLISGSSAFSKFSLYICKFSVHILLKPGLGDFALVQLCSSLSILWRCPSFMLEWKLAFSNPMAAAEFSKFAGIFSAALSQHLLGYEIAQLEFHHLH